MTETNAGKAGTNTIAVCMAVYNGSFYLPEQIESILAQTYRDWVLYIRDDGSADSTPAIARDYAGRYPDRIFFLNDMKSASQENAPACSTKSGSTAAGENREGTAAGSTEAGSEPRGSRSNFAKIVRCASEYGNHAYYMTADQDDVWLPDKIEKTLASMKAAEKKRSGGRCPVLVHTDLKVTDAKLQELSPSLFAYRALDPSVKDLRRLLVQNNVTGCTVMWNRALNGRLRYPDENVITYDWWLSLTAACFGEIVCRKEPLILYRQHGMNVVGAVKVNSLSFIRKRLSGLDYVRATLRSAAAQAGSFRRIYDGELTPEQKRIIGNFADIYGCGKARRIFRIVRGRHFKQGAVQIIGELLFI